MDIIEKLNNRYATKLFSNQQISNDDLKIILESARLSASSFGLQPYKLIVINNPDLREKLKKASFGQPQVTDASHIVIFAAQREVDSSTIENYLTLVSKTRNIQRESLNDYGAMMNNKVESLTQNGKLKYWVNRQIYIALGSVLETAALLDIDACPMEGFSTDEVDEILGLNTLGVRSVVMCALGYRANEDKYQHLAKVRQSSSDFYIHL